MDDIDIFSQLPEIQPDIFLCTRELPDKLTAETAGLRQLCSALAGEGYRVFFPSALPKELSDEERARRIVNAIKSAKVMVAAGIGPEGLNDVFSKAVWNAFLKNSPDAADRFILCWRDAGETPFPQELAGRTPLDMSDLRFLVELKEKLSALLPPPVRADAPEDQEDPAPEEESPAPEEDAAGDDAADKPAKKPFPWPLVVLGVIAVVLIWLILK